jgi:hypothetical protein
MSHQSNSALFPLAISHKLYSNIHPHTTYARSRLCRCIVVQYTKKMFALSMLLIMIGWLNSVAGIVKTYIRSRFDREQQQSAKENNEKLKSLASVSPIPPATTNPFAQTPPNPLATIRASQNSRHASPDPPPRKTRGSQSPLILRRKLELATTSPLLGKR